LDPLFRKQKYKNKNIKEIDLLSCFVGKPDLQTEFLEIIEMIYF